MATDTNNLDKLATANKKAEAKRAADRLSAFDSGGPTAGADWGGCSPKWVLAVVEKITRLDGAVTFGTSRDRGAHSVTLLLDDSRKTIWIGASESLNDKLETICATLDTMA